MPQPGRVTAALEDDFHCMTVALHHDGATITAVDAEMLRWPWTTCPGAVTVLRSSFTGRPIAKVAASELKSSNCTHLYDLAVFAAAHAADEAPCIYDVFVGDPVYGRKHAEIRRDGSVVLAWEMVGDVLQSLSELMGTHVMALRDWITALDTPLQEAARILQWASLIAHGRTIPLDQQSDATKMPPNCYSFQPDRAKKAVRIGEIIDFSESLRRPLEGM